MLGCPTGVPSGSRVLVFAAKVGNPPASPPEPAHLKPPSVGIKDATTHSPSCTIGRRGDFMTIDRIRTIGRAALAAILLALCVPPTLAQQAPRPASDLTVTSPEAVGFSTQRLERLHALMQQAVDQKQIAGIVTTLARHGKVIDYRTYGQRDMASGAPMTKDVIFRDFSMTKPVTGVAMMILYEEGKWLPSDPIAKYIPEFAHLKVYKGVDADGKMIL